VLSDATYLESKLFPFDRTPDAEWIEQYDYDSDSDLGYSSDDEDSEASSTSSKSLTSGNLSNKFRHFFADRPPGSDDPPIPITDKTADQNTLDLSQDSQQMADITRNLDVGVLQQNIKPPPISSGERVGKIVCIKDTAYVTLVLPNSFLHNVIVNRGVSIPAGGQ
jgi:hypothetical protein